MSASISDELNNHIKALGRDILSLDPEKFKSWASSLDDEVVELLLKKHRSNRDFYKRIMMDERRKKFPKAFIYQDAEEKLRKYNIQGKILKEIVESLN